MSHKLICQQFLERGLIESAEVATRESALLKLYNINRYVESILSIELVLTHQVFWELM